MCIKVEWGRRERRGDRDLKVLGRKNLGVSSGAEGLKVWESWRPLSQEVLEVTPDPARDLGVRICIYAPSSPCRSPPLDPLLCYVGWAHCLSLYCWVSLASRPCWCSPAGSERVCSEPTTFYTYLHGHVPLNWNQHRISVLFISFKFFLLLNYDNFTEDQVVSSVEIWFLHKTSRWS